MLPVDWALVAYGVCIPLLIALYVFVLCIIMRRRKSYDASFHKIFTALGGVNIGACLVSTFVFRLPHYPLVNYFYSSLMVGWWLSVANSGVHFLITLSEFLGVLLAFNRFTALFFSQWHDQIWRWFFSIGVILCALVSFAPVWHLLTDETRFYEADEAREGYKFYYLDTKANYPKAQTSIWFNMVVVVLTSNIISFLLYVACLVRLRCCSAKKYPSIERNLFIAGFLTLICSLPYTICKTIFYLEISSPVDAKNVELIRFWGFQQPWLLDLMHLTPAPLLILTSNTIRKDIRKMLCSRNTA